MYCAPQAVAAANAAFAPRLAGLVERHCAALQDFNGEAGETVALSLGCGVGGTATALADSFQRVVAVDASQLCIDAAKVWKPYTPHPKSCSSIAAGSTLPSAQSPATYSPHAEALSVARAVSLLGSSMGPG